MESEFINLYKCSVGDKIPVPPLKPLPLDDVPMWTKLPYDTKYPLLECKDITLSREDLGKTLYPTFPDKDFDLTRSPTPVPDHSAYSSLHDPHLRHYFQSALRYKNLVRKGLITKDGKVKSCLQEYNQYRMYLYHLWVLQVNQLKKHQVLEENKRLKSLLQAHESEDSLYTDVAGKRDKVKVEEILDEMSSKLFQSKKPASERRLTPLEQSLIHWKMYQEKLRKDFKQSYPDVKEWLCNQTKHYKQLIEKKLNAKRSRDKKMRSRWEKILESSRARLNKELQLRELEQERKRNLSEQRYYRAKALWVKNEREMKLRRRSGPSKFFSKLLPISDSDSEEDQISKSKKKAVQRSTWGKEDSGLSEEEDDVSFSVTECDSPSKTSSSIDQKKIKHLKRDIGPHIYEDKKSSKMISRKQSLDAVTDGQNSSSDSDIPTLAEEKTVSNINDLREKNILKKAKKLFSVQKTEQTLDKIPKESSLELQRFQAPMKTKSKSQFHIDKAVHIQDIENELLSPFVSKTSITDSLKSDAYGQESDLQKYKVSRCKKKYSPKMTTAAKKEISMTQKIDDLDEIYRFSVDKLPTEDIAFRKECEEVSVLDDKSQIESKISQLSAAKAKHAPLGSSEQSKLFKYLYGLPELDEREKMKYEIQREQRKKSFTLPERSDILKKSRHDKNIDPIEGRKEILLSLNKMNINKKHQHHDPWNVLEISLKIKKQQLHKLIGLEKENLISRSKEKIQSEFLYYINSVNSSYKHKKILLDEVTDEVQKKEAFSKDPLKDQFRKSCPLDAEEYDMEEDTEIKSYGTDNDSYSSDEKNSRRISVTAFKKRQADHRHFKVLMPDVNLKEKFNFSAFKAINRKLERFTDNSDKRSCFELNNTSESKNLISDLLKERKNKLEAEFFTFFLDKSMRSKKSEGAYSPCDTSFVNFVDLEKRNEENKPQITSVISKEKDTSINQHFTETHVDISKSPKIIHPYEFIVPSYSKLQLPKLRKETQFFSPVSRIKRREVTDKKFDEKHRCTTKSTSYTKTGKDRDKTELKLEQEKPTAKESKTAISEERSKTVKSKEKIRAAPQEFIPKDAPEEEKTLKGREIYFRGLLDHIIMDAEASKIKIRADEKLKFPSYTQESPQIEHKTLDHGYNLHKKECKFPKEKMIELKNGKTQTSTKHENIIKECKDILNDLIVTIEKETKLRKYQQPQEKNGLSKIDYNLDETCPEIREKGRKLAEYDKYKTKTHEICENEKDRTDIDEFSGLIIQDTEKQRLSKRYSEQEDETGEKSTEDKDYLDTFVTEYKAEDNFKDKGKLEVTAKTIITSKEKKLDNDICRRESVSSTEKEANVVTSTTKGNGTDFVTSDFVIKKKGMKHFDEQSTEEILSDASEICLTESGNILSEKTTENEYTEEPHAQQESFSAKCRKLHSTVIPENLDYETVYTNMYTTDSTEIFENDLEETDTSIESVLAPDIVPSTPYVLQDDMKFKSNRTEVIPCKYIQRKDESEASQMEKYTLQIQPGASKPIERQKCEGSGKSKRETDLEKPESSVEGTDYGLKESALTGKRTGNIRKEIHFEDGKDKSQNAEENVTVRSREDLEQDDSVESSETSTAKLPVLNEKIPDKISEQYSAVHSIISQGFKYLDNREMISNNHNEILTPIAQNIASIIESNMICSLNEVQRIISSEELNQLYFLNGEVKHELYNQTRFRGGKNFLGNVAYFDKELSNFRPPRKSFKSRQLSLEHSRLKKLARRLYNESLTKTGKSGLIPSANVAVREASDFSEKVYAFSPALAISNIEKTSLEKKLAQTQSSWMPDASSEIMRHQFAITTALTDVSKDQEIKEEFSKKPERESKDIMMHISVDKMDLPDSQSITTSDSEYSLCDEEDEEKHLWTYQIHKDAERDLYSERETEVKSSLFDLAKREDVLQPIANFLYPQRLSFFEINYGDDPFGYLRTFLTLDTRKFLILPQHAQRSDMEKVPDYLQFKKFFESATGEEEIGQNLPSDKVVISMCAESDKKIISEISAESIEYTGLTDDNQNLLSTDVRPSLRPLSFPVESVNYMDKILMSAKKQNIKISPNFKFDKFTRIETASLVPTSINYEPISAADLYCECSEPSQFIFKRSETAVQSETLDSKSAVCMQKPLLDVPSQGSEIRVDLAKEVLENGASGSDSVTPVIGNIDSVKINFNFSDSLVSAEIDRNKFKLLFTECIGEIFKKCMIRKSYQFMTEIQEDIIETYDTNVPELPNEMSSDKVEYLINSFDDKASDYTSQQMLEKSLPTTSQKNLCDYDHEEDACREKLVKFTPFDDDGKEKNKKISNGKYKASILPKGSFGIIKQDRKLEKKDGLSRDISKFETSYSDSNATDNATICTDGTTFESPVQGSYLEENNVIEEEFEKRKDKHLTHLVPKIFHPLSDSDTTSSLQNPQAVKLFEYIENPLSKLLKQPIKITDIFITRDVSLSELPAYAKSQSCDIYFRASPVPEYGQCSETVEDRRLQYSELEENAMENEVADTRRSDLLSRGTLQLASFSANILRARMNIAEIYTMAEERIQLLEKYFEENPVKLRRMKMTEIYGADTAGEENDSEQEE